MSMPFFQYLAPTSKEEALSMRARHPAEKLEVIAGGTEILGRLKHGLNHPDYAMSLKSVKELSGTAFEKDKVMVGSATTLRDIIKFERLRGFTAIVEAAIAVAAPPIQNVATIAGNILQQTRCLRYNQSELVRKSMTPCYKMGGAVCNVVQGGRRCFSVYQGDVAPALMTFGALLQIETAVSSRTIQISELFAGQGEKPFLIEGDELLTRIILPIPQGSYGSAYKKLRLRGALDYPLAASAVFLSFSGDGSVSSARIVVGAAGPAPKRVEAAEAILINKHPDQKDIEEAADQASKAAQVVENLPLPAAYRRSMIGVMTKRAIADALQETKKVQSR
jgi:4-hydroxybenzoyl-CoA reductase subunit beta